jgi:tetratricopeptide (TPR) repeat protein
MSENMVRINAQLTDAITGGHLWAQRYDEQMDNIFDLQDKITQKIVELLAVKLTIEENELAPKKETNNLKAYLTFLKGWQHYRQFNLDGFSKAIPLFEKAIELDPNYWRAYAALAKVYLELHQRAPWRRELGLSYADAYTLRYEYLDIAMKDPTPLALEVAVESHIERREFEKALTVAEQAINLDSNDPESHMAMGQALMKAGRHDEAADSFKKAIRLDPHYKDKFGYALGAAYFFMLQFEKAANLFEIALKSNPENTTPLWFLTATYAHLGRDQEARVALARLKETNPLYSNLRSIRMIFRTKDQADFDLFIEGLEKAGMD